MYIIVFTKKDENDASIAISNDLDFIFYSKDGKLGCCRWLKKFEEIGKVTEIYQTKFNVAYTWFDDMVSKMKNVDNRGFDLYNLYRVEILGEKECNNPFMQMQKDNSLVLLKSRFLPGTIIRHFKRELVDSSNTQYLYLYIGQVKHTETGEEFALYSALYTDRNKGIRSGDMFVRPLYQFFGLVDKIKYPEIKQQFRFEATTLNVEKGECDD